MNHSKALGSPTCLYSVCSAGQRCKSCEATLSRGLSHLDQTTTQWPPGRTWTIANHTRARNYRDQRAPCHSERTGLTGRVTKLDTQQLAVYLKTIVCSTTTLLLCSKPLHDLPRTAWWKFPRPHRRPSLQSQELRELEHYIYLQKALLEAALTPVVAEMHCDLVDLLPGLLDL
jgi:hypothetical protein